MYNSTRQVESSRVDSSRSRVQSSRSSPVQSSRIKRNQNKNQNRIE